jgi:hypothetical protein
MFHAQKLGVPAFELVALAVLLIAEQLAALDGLSYGVNLFLSHAIHDFSPGKGAIAQRR